MKRDMELIRKVLLAVQDLQLDSPIDSYSADEVKYHKALAIEAGLIKGSVLKGVTEIPVAVMVTSLTWTGHDLIDAIAAEANWQKVKNFLKEAGKQVTIETIKVAVAQLFGFG